MPCPCHLHHTNKTNSQIPAKDEKTRAVEDEEKKTGNKKKAMGKDEAAQKKNESQKQRRMDGQKFKE
jgi:hypothetical protein